LKTERLFTTVFRSSFFVGVSPNTNEVSRSFLIYIYHFSKCRKKERKEERKKERNRKCDFIFFQSYLLHVLFWNSRGFLIKENETGLPRPTKVRIWIEIHFIQRRNCSTKVTANFWTVETHFINQGTFQKVWNAERRD
jgi:hypothetical protein